jgi:hypothetical protein
MSRRCDLCRRGESGGAIGCRYPDYGWVLHLGLSDVLEKLRRSQGQHLGRIVLRACLHALLGCRRYSSTQVPNYPPSTERTIPRSGDRA